MKFNVSKMLKSVGKTLGKHSPEILAGLGIVGMITTAVTAVKATPKAMLLINEEQEKHEEKLTKREVVKTAWKCYIPAAITCTMSIACLVGASSTNYRRRAALATAYGISETALKEYRDKVIETIGESKEQKVRDAVAKDKMKNNPVSSSEVFMAKKGDALCYDSVSGRYFKSDIDLIKKAVIKLNHQLLNDMYITLNELYYELGLAPIKIGDNLGWDVDDGYIELNYSSQLADDGTPCLVIDYSPAPRFKR